MIAELFRGPGGWAEGLKMLGLTDIGLELDADAARTAHAAGHPTIRCDVTQYPTAPFAGRITGKISSPVCTPFSAAGKQGGLVDLPLVYQAVHDLAHGRDTRSELKAACKDAKSILAAEPMRWLYDLRPEWVCMEQVPSVLPLWQQYAGILRGWGYSVWTGILNAADYGVPQTRRRAILIASSRRPVTAPGPTHAEEPQLDLFGVCLRPWVSMADALGLPPGVVVNTRGDRPKDAKGRAAGGNEFLADQPSWTLTEKTRSWALRNNTQKGAAVRTMDQPAGTLFFGARLNNVSWIRTDTGEEIRRITEQEASVLQSFPADHPWNGSRSKRFLQIGNAVPPLLAAHVVSAATGIPMPAAEPRAEAA